MIRDSEHALIQKRPSKGLLASLYELPNLEGRLMVDEVLQYVEHCGFSPIRIMELPPAKHIFSHIEWHMTGYMVLVEDVEEIGIEKTAEQVSHRRSLFIQPQQTEQEYPIPAAFAAYTKYLSIKLGQEKYRETGEI